jgi:hypothetical protein
MFTIRKSLVAALVAGAAFVPSALAQGGPGGGGGGGAVPAPPTTFPGAVCAGPNPVANVSWIPISGGNCITLQQAANGDLTLDGVSAGPGYAFTVRKAETNVIDVVFTDGNAAQTHEYTRNGTSVRVR